MSVGSAQPSSTPDQNQFCWTAWRAEGGANDWFKVWEGATMSAGPVRTGMVGIAEVSEQRSASIFKVKATKEATVKLMSEMSVKILPNHTASHPRG
jgi:hypothetical protein